MSVFNKLTIGNEVQEMLITLINQWKYTRDLSFNLQTIKKATKNTILEFCLKLTNSICCSIV